jgi:hypothetical protein
MKNIDHVYEPASYGDYECKLCGIDAYTATLDERYEYCDLNKVLQIPVVRNKPMGKWKRRYLIFCRIFFFRRNAH